MDETAKLGWREPALDVAAAAVVGVGLPGIGLAIVIPRRSQLVCGDQDTLVSYLDNPRCVNVLTARASGLNIN